MRRSRPPTENGTSRRPASAGRQRALGAGGVSLDEDGELVAADAGDGVADAHAGAQPLADRHEQPVAGVVAEAVVHGLEVVEVDEEHRHGLVAPRSSACSRRSRNRARLASRVRGSWKAWNPAGPRVRGAPSTVALRWRLSTRFSITVTAWRNEEQRVRDDGPDGQEGPDRPTGRTPCGRTSPGRERAAGTASTMLNSDAGSAAAAPRRRLHRPAERGEGEEGEPERPPEVGQGSLPSVPIAVRYANAPSATANLTTPAATTGGAAEAIAATREHRDRDRHGDDVGRGVRDREHPFDSSPRSSCRRRRGTCRSSRTPPCRGS